MNNIESDSNKPTGIWDDKLGATPSDFDRKKVKSKGKAIEINDNRSRAYEGQSSGNEEDSKQDDV